MKRASNHINKIRDVHSIAGEDSEGIVEVVVNSFDIFRTAVDHFDIEDVLSCIDMRVTRDMNARLGKPYVASEVELALKECTLIKPLAGWFQCFLLSEVLGCGGKICYGCFS